MHGHWRCDGIEIESIKEQPSAKLVAGSFSRNGIGLIGQTQSQQYEQCADPAKPCPPLCPPGGVSGCVRRFPLGAQIVIALIIAGAAWLALWRALRPFGQIVISRRDVRQAISYGLLGFGLLALSAWTWVLPG
ncbi:hypothetical protein [Sphingomonas sp.]|uniref:hypothetical protein n=1 Tax=Sphingomonas sp. TaxID=28214 RepID=UPI0035A91413